MQWSKSECLKFNYRMYLLKSKRSAIADLLIEKYWLSPEYAINLLRLTQMIYTNTRHLTNSTLKRLDF